MLDTFHKLEAATDSNLSWQYRTVLASLGTTTGCIVQAILAKQPRKGPAFGSTCNITSDGMVETMVRRTQEGKVYVPPRMECIGSVIDVRDNLRKLSDHCKLDDADRIALFDQLQKWIKVDWRAKSEI